MSEEKKDEKAGENDLTEKPGINRRDFVAYSAVGAAAMFGLGGVATVSSPELVRPPGGQDQKRFQACIRCEKCIEACPHRAIKIAHLEDGFANIRTPMMEFKNGYCDFCADYGYVPQCAVDCPVGALQVPSDKTGSLEISRETVIGKAIITRDWCLGWALMGCRTCVDNCPHEAIILDDDRRPYVVGDKCNGCGICEFVCLSKSNGSLTGSRSGATDRAIVIKPTSLVESLNDSERGWAS